MSPTASLNRYESLASPHHEGRTVASVRSNQVTSRYQDMLKPTTLLKSKSINRGHSVARSVYSWMTGA